MSRQIRRRDERRMAKAATRRPDPPAPSKTYWNGEPCRAERVRVRVGANTPHPAAWYAGMAGTIRAAVVVYYHGDRFFLDDEGYPGAGPIEECTGGDCKQHHPGTAWRKVTIGRGSPNFGHRSLPRDSEIIE